jgi:2'-5' RNA ligase
VVLLDELAPAVAAARYELDPSARGRVPLHVTLLFPFVPRRDVTPALVAGLRQVFLRQPRPSFALDRIEAFPGEVAYAAPEPAETVLSVIRAVCEAYPQYPPYGGLFTVDELVPHATMATIADGDAGVVRARVEPLLPARCEPAAASLIEEVEPDRWRELEPLPFGEGRV